MSSHSALLYATHTNFNFFFSGSVQLKRVYFISKIKFQISFRNQIQDNSSLQKIQCVVVHVLSLCVSMAGILEICMQRWNVCSSMLLTD